MASPLQRWLFVGLFVIVVASGAVGGYLWWTTRDVQQHLQVFFGDTQAMFLVPVEEDAMLPQPSRPEAWAAAVVEQMRQAPNKDVTSLVTPDVKLLVAQWHAPTWTLHVQMGTGQGSVTESLLAGSLVRTFVASYPGAQQVELRLFGPDGKPYLSQHLDLSKPLTAADFSNRVDGGTSGLPTTLWWKVAAGDKLVPVQVPLKGGSGTPAKDAFNRLLAGPPQEASAFLRPVVPPGLTPEFAGFEDGVATINLNREVPAGAEGEQFIESLVLTLTEVPGVKAVQFLRDGLPMPATVVGPFQLDKPIERPREVNDAASSDKP